MTTENVADALKTVDEVELAGFGLYQCDDDYSHNATAQQIRWMLQERGVKFVEFLSTVIDHGSEDDVYPATEILWFKPTDFDYESIPMRQPAFNLRAAKLVSEGYLRITSQVGTLDTCVHFLRPRVGG